MSADETQEQTPAEQTTPVETPAEPVATSQELRPQAQSADEALAQAKADALSPEQKFENYLEDIVRLHAESAQG